MYRMTHPLFGTRTVGAEQVTAYERTGWSKEAEVVAEPAAGTISEITTAVGSDPDAAREALAAEQSRSKPRPTLVAALTQVIEDATTSTSSTTDTEQES